MKTTIQIKHLRPRSTDGFDPYRNTEWYSKEEIIKKAETFHFMHSFRGYDLQDFVGYLLSESENMLERKGDE